MEQTQNTNIFSHLKSDIPASIVVFLVALPLCLGIALASGAPLFSGIIAGIIGGIVVTAFSKSQLGVSGPAAGLAVVVFNAIGELGAFDIFLMAVVIGGIFQILLGILKTGVFGYYLPSSVIKGMLSGIGVIIILKQIPHAFGYDADPEGDMSFFQADGHNTFSEFFYMMDNISLGALVISIVCLAILIFWESNFMKNLSFTKIIPGPLVAVLAGVGMNISFEAIEMLSLHGDHVVSIPVNDSLEGFFGQFTTPNFAALADSRIYMVAITLAVIASVETLLCVEATDKLDPQKRITPPNRELIAQGIGNTISGLIGGLPITQVIVRSSANIQSGGKSRVSAFVHGVLLLICAISIPHLLNLIPLASLAAILLTVGYKLVKPQIFKDMYKTGNSQYYSYIATIVFIVFTDLLTGIGLGLVVALLFILWENFKSPFELDLDNYKEGDLIKIQLSENVSFLNKAGVIKTLNSIPSNSKVVLDASNTKSIHWDVMEIIEDYKINAASKNIELKFEGFDKI